MADFCYVGENGGQKDGEEGIANHLPVKGMTYAFNNQQRIKGIWYAHSVQCLKKAYLMRYQRYIKQGELRLYQEFTLFLLPYRSSHYIQLII